MFNHNKDNDIKFVSSIKHLLNETKTVMVCVKPQDMQKALVKNAADITGDHLVLSIAAGTQLRQIEGVI